jgi:glycosyltransferase involved in cell wall biosynthesis
VFLKKSLNSADHIITDSEFTYRERLRFYPHLPKSKVITVPIGYFRHTSNGLKISRGDFLYCSGSMEPRKNLKNLIFTLELLKKEGLEIKLVLTGPFGWKNRNFRNLLENTPIRNQVENYAFVSQKELCHLYQTCRAFIFHSLYEGFSLPVLEAFSFHTPILTSRGIVMEEVAGPCALYFDAQSPQAIAKTICSFWKDPVPLSLHKERLVILEKYTWEKTDQTILKIFEDLYKGKTAC